MSETTERLIDHDRAMDAMKRIGHDRNLTSVEQSAWRCLRKVVRHVEEYRQNAEDHMSWGFPLRHTYERIGYRSCWSSDPEGRENEDAPWHVSDSGVEFRILMDSHGTHQIHIVGELDGYGAACAYELRYRDDYDGEKGVLNLRELDVRWTRGVPLSAGIDVSAYVDRCLEDYCGWVAGPIQEL